IRRNFTSSEEDCSHEPGGSTPKGSRIVATGGAKRNPWNGSYALPRQGQRKLRNRAEIEPLLVEWAYSPTVSRRTVDASVGEYAHPTFDVCQNTGLMQMSRHLSSDILRVIQRRL